MGEPVWLQRELFLWLGEFNLILIVTCVWHKQR
jgi:hypothetical protein